MAQPVKPSAAELNAPLRSTSSAGVGAGKRHGTIEKQVAGSRPVDLAQRPLFAPIAELLSRCTTHALASCDELNHWVEELSPHPESAAARRLRFVVPDKASPGYEQRVHTRGEVVTRPDNWHDFFNALVWLRFPQTKVALNAAHLRFMGHRGTGRGPVRDAVTQFDESGIIVVSADSSLLDLLMRRRWKELFWTRRAEVAASMRFLVFGHGLYDALRAPFYRICGRAAAIVVDRAVLELEIAALCNAIDPLLAARFRADYYPRPRALLALPLLGIPGVTPDNASPAYYDDREQFRPLPEWM